MKADVSRLPATLARLRPVTERLGMTERAYVFDYFSHLLPSASMKGSLTNCCV